VFSNPKTILISCLIVLLIGCAPADRRVNTFSSPALNTRVSTPAALLEINSISVLPVIFDVKTRHLSGSEVAGSLYGNLEAVLRNEMDIDIVSGQELRGVGDLSEVPASSHLIEIARTNRTDSVLMTQLHSYFEKIGTQYSASQPAMVDFSMSLFNADLGRVVWQSTYHFRDQALSENVLRLQEYLYAKRGPRWMTAVEIWRHGLELAVQDLALRRTMAFEEPQQ